MITNRIIPARLVPVLMAPVLLAPVLLAPVLLAAAVAFPGPALAAEGGHIKDISYSFEGPFGTFDKHQLQRGFQVYHQVCSACHGLKYLSFRSLGNETGPGFPADEVKAIAASYQVPDPASGPGATRPGKPYDNFPAVTSVGAPDLSVMAKARAAFHGPYGLGINQLIHGQGGPEYIHAILTSFTGKTVQQAGTTLYLNTAFPSGKIRMPPPLSDGAVDYKAYTPEGTVTTKTDYQPPKPTVDQMARDVSAFLMWAADPHMVERKESGFRNIIFLIVLTVLLYFTNKALWAPIKRQDQAEGTE